MEIPAQTLVCRGFWDSQKKVVAQQFLPTQVMFVRLAPREIYDWYEELLESQQGETLIAADGVHPNSYCYSFWARNLGRKLSEAWNNATITNPQLPLDIDRRVVS